ncbi:MAG: NAD(P)/FAD-dependent oxidoreductase [Acidimicrobiales bacterium]
MSSADVHTNGSYEDFDAVVVGGGLGGIGAGITLMNAGMKKFVLIEKADGLGGVWHHNIYPGCVCDVPSVLYSFGFRPNPNWSRFFAPQSEIRQYLLDMAAESGVAARARVSTEMLSASWDEDASRWLVKTTKGSFRSRILILAVGSLHASRLPEIDGLDTFEGKIFHSAKWPEGYDYKGERIAVIGTGASAVQAVPELAKEANRLVVFQRTPQWVWPKPNWNHSSVTRSVFARFPGTQRTLRKVVWAFTELTFARLYKPDLSKRLQSVPRWNLTRSVPEGPMRDALTPTYIQGCRRVLYSNTFYPALMQPNVELCASAAVGAGPDWIAGSDGVRHQVDTIVCATGFRFGAGPVPALVTGRGGKRLSEVWKEGAHAYLGTTVHGFPNMALVWGPNAATASQFVGTEAQLRYLRGMLSSFTEMRIESLEVREEKELAWKAEADEVLSHTVHNKAIGGCTSPYIDASGRNHALFPGSMKNMWDSLEHFDVSAYRFTEQERSSVASPSLATKPA